MIVVIRALFVHVTNKLSLVLSNIGSHKFIVLSNNDNQRETVLLNDLKTATLKHTVDFIAATTDATTITLFTTALSALLLSYMYMLLVHNENIELLVCTAFF
ncbi:hypothetical protein T08_2502 [Trichinella sp. T8]|nr:hypothetical protein T08_2502 [Trichinella sp. T8]